MAVFNTSRSRNPYQATGPGWSRELITDVVTVAITTAMIDNADDDVGLLYVPAGAVIVGVGLSSTALAASALVLDVGDAADEDRLIDASIIGVAGGLDTGLEVTGFLHKYTVATQLRLYVAVAAVTPAAGTIEFAVTYFVDPDFNTTALVASVG